MHLPSFRALELSLLLLLINIFATPACEETSTAGFCTVNASTVNVIFKIKRIEEAALTDTLTFDLSASLVDLPLVLPRGGSWAAGGGALCSGGAASP